MLDFSENAEYFNSENWNVLKLPVFFFFFFCLKVSSNNFQKYENVAAVDMIFCKKSDSLLLSHFCVVSIFVRDVYRLLEKPFVASVLLDSV